MSGSNSEKPDTNGSGADQLLISDKTPDTELDEQPAALTPRLVLSCIAAACGSLHFGWNTGVINNPKSSISAFLNASVSQRYDAQLDELQLGLLWSACVSIFAIGGMAGALAGGAFADKVGRQRALGINSIFGLVAAGISAAAKPSNSPEMLLAARLLTGLCSAVYTCVVPLYIAEVTPSRIRGAMGVTNQLGVVLGLLLSQILSMDKLLGSSQLWPVALAGGGLCCLVQLLLLPLCPESPRYLLLTRKQPEKALQALALLRGVRAGSSVLSCELQLASSAAEQREEKQQSDTEAGNPDSSFADFCRSRRLAMPLLVGIALHLSQQLSGINVIFYYSSDLFKLSGASDSLAAYATVAVGGVMVVMTCVSVPLMEAAGRRTLHLLGLLGLLLSGVAFTISFSVQRRLADTNETAASVLTVCSVLFALLIVVSFAIGPGSIPWLMVSELFDQQHRSGANAVCVLVNWLANFCVGLLFPVLASSLQSLLFLPFSCITAALMLLLYCKLPETKSRSFEEIAASFEPDASQVTD